MAITIDIPDPREQPTLSVPEAGARLGLSRGASYRAVREGAIPVIRLGQRRTRVPTVAVLHMLGLDPIDATERQPHVA